MLSFIARLVLIPIVTVAAYNAASAQEKTEASPGALDKSSGNMKKHEKDTRDQRNATPERGQEMKAQGQNSK